METISVDREYDAPEHRLRSVFDDVTTFFDAAGFDVARTHDRLELSKQVAVTQFELYVKLRETTSPASRYIVETEMITAMRRICRLWNTNISGSSLSRGNGV